MVDIADEREIICKITGSELQDNFKIHIDYLDHILNNLQAKEEDLINKKLTVAVFCSKVLISLKRVR
jgi:hypothetical protein